MAKLLKLRRGTTSQHSSFTGAEGEVTVDLDKETLVVHDGSTAGGHPVAAEDMANVSSASIAGRLGNDSIATSKIAAGALPSDVTVASANIVDDSIVNADVNASAAIAGTKVAPAFGSQNLSTSGTAATGALTVTGNIGVSGTVDGRDVAADGTKLDGIETAATADQTAAEIRTLVESASDSNVFTDGDHTKLNGIEASATADQTDAEIRAAVEAASDSNVFTDADHTKLNGIEASATADQTGAEILALINSSDIYTTSSIGRDAGDKLYFTDNTSLDVILNGSTEFRFEADGDFHADGDLIAFSSTVASDINLKENIGVVPNALEKVEALNGVTFNWKKTGEKSAGVIAQEVQAILPEAVKEVTPIGGGDSHLTVNYHALTSILIESIKQLKAEIDELKGGK